MGSHGNIELNSTQSNDILKWIQLDWMLLKGIPHDTSRIPVNLYVVLNEMPVNLMFCNGIPMNSMIYWMEFYWNGCNWMGSHWILVIEFNSTQFNSTQHNSIQFNSLNWIQLNWLNWIDWNLSGI